MARVMRPTVPQLLFAVTTVAAVIAMPTDALTGSTSTLSHTPAIAGPAATNPAVANPAATDPTAAGSTATDPTAPGPGPGPATVTPIQQVRPSVNEQIAQAVLTSPLLGDVPPEHIEVADVHVSTVDPTVAAAHVVPTGGETDPATALLRHGSSQGSHWTLVELGTAGVGCDTLGPAVRDDLGLVCGDQPVG
ncbi:hypothetical protein [Protofrankia symbiont of Coriaria ruscifolia]|uniref:hypothetical protein n=1 Tax=Protofrankia symbiont of Coriaria ruscifolia TaxID=1306542 RepID=UPI001A93A942|nr:hypothetical protein [Protofrankia symbiont of Coriaria ruscifolia]